MKKNILICVLLFFPVALYASQDYRFHWGVGVAPGTFAVNSFDADNAHNINSTFFNNSMSLGYLFNNSNFGVTSGYSISRLYSEFSVKNTSHIIHGEVFKIPLLLRYEFDKSDFGISLFSQIGIYYARDFDIKSIPENPDVDFLVNNIGYTFNTGLRYYHPGKVVLYFDCYLDTGSDFTGDVMRMHYFSLNGRMGFLFSSYNRDN